MNLMSRIVDVSWKDVESSFGVETIENVKDGRNIKGDFE